MKRGLWGGTTGHIKVGFLLNTFWPCFWLLMERGLGSVCKMRNAVWDTWLLNIKRCSVFRAQFCYYLLSQGSWNYSQLMSGKTYLFNVYFISVIINMSSLSYARFKTCLRGWQNSLFSYRRRRSGREIKQHWTTQLVEKGSTELKSLMGKNGLAHLSRATDFCLTDWLWRLLNSWVVLQNDREWCFSVLKQTYVCWWYRACGRGAEKLYMCTHKGV